MVDAWQSAWIEVLPDFSGFKSKADKELNSSLGSAGTSGGLTAGKNLQGGIIGGVKSLAGPIVGVVAALGIGKLVGDAIGEGIRYSIDAVGIASDLSETRAAIGTVFGDAAADIIAFSETANKSLGSTRQAALSGAQTFGIFAKSAGLTGKPLAKFSTDLVTLAGDMASFYNADPSQVIEDLGAGLRGEAEPLRKYGVLLDDATLKARALALGIYDGKDALTGQQKILASQAEIFAQTGLAQGDFAKTSGGLANQQRILAASLEDTQAKLGEALLPAFTDITTYANQNLVPALGAFLDKVGPGIGDALLLAQPALEELALKLTPLVDEFARAASDEGIPGFIEAMNDAADAAPEWLQAFDDFSEGFAEFEQWFADAQQDTADAFKPFRDGVTEAYEAFVAFSDGVYESGEDLRAALGAIDFGASIEGWRVTIGEGLGVLVEQFQLAGGQAIIGFINGLGDLVGVKKAAQAIGNVASVALRDVLGIRSPSRVFAELGVYTAEGFAKGITGSRSLVDSAVSSMVSIPTIADATVSGSLALVGAAAGSSDLAASGPKVVQNFNGVPNQSMAELAQISKNAQNEELRGLG